MFPRCSPSVPVPALAICSAFCSALGLALAFAPPAAAQELSIPYEQYTLDNGLVVMLHVDHASPQVVVNTWYDVGAKDEEVGRTGFAHLFEHLMFMGTTRLPDNGYDVEMERHGGWNNAWTSEDATDYYDVGPSHLLELLLWMEADRMDGLSTAMTQEKLDRQREVVRNERRQSYEDSPYGVAWLAMPEILYPSGHPYAHTVIGSHEDLEAATVDDVVRFFDTWYVPANAGLVVAGDFDPSQARAWIDATYGSIPARPAPERAAPPAAVDLPVTPLTELTDQVQASRTWMLWHTPAAFAEGDAALDIVSGILHSGRASRLYGALVTESGHATEVHAAQYSQQLGSIFVVSLTPAEGADCATVETEAQAELTRLATDGPTGEELARTKAKLSMDFLQGLEALQTRASLLNRYRVLTGDPGFLAKDLERYGAVDAEAVKAAAAMLSESRRAVIRVHPEPTSDADADGGAQ